MDESTKLVCDSYVWVYAWERYVVGLYGCSLIGQ